MFNEYCLGDNLRGPVFSLATSGGYSTNSEGGNFWKYLQVRIRMSRRHCETTTMIAPDRHYLLQNNVCIVSVSNTQIRMDENIIYRSQESLIVA